MVKSGEIAATILIAGKPTGSFAKFKLEPGMTLLPVPYIEALEQDYFPAKLTNEDYPNLIPKGSSVDTVAVGAVLAAYNWPANTDRYRRVALFIDAFFAKFPRIPEAGRATPSGGRPTSPRRCAAGSAFRPPRNGWPRTPTGRPPPAPCRSIRHRARAGRQGRAQRSSRAGAPVPAVHGVGQVAEALAAARRGADPPGSLRRGHGGLTATEKETA